MSVGIEQILTSIRQLPPTDQERLKRLLDTEHTSFGANDDNRTANSLRWLNENRQNYLGLWVALDGSRLIASGGSAREVFGRAKALGIDSPFIELVTAEEVPPFSGGWLS
mgnify:CR=1 FL=1